MYDDDDRFEDDDYFGRLAGKLARQRRREARYDFEDDGGRERRLGRHGRREHRRHREIHWD